ncbi:MAG: hypothetical protein ACK5HP_04070 [Bacilli bacterium]
MAKLTFEDFMKLSNEEKCIRYKEMNDVDRQKARMTEPLGKHKPIGYIELTEEQKIKGKEMIEEIKKIREISPKIND